MESSLYTHVHCDTHEILHSTCTWLRHVRTECSSKVITLQRRDTFYCRTKGNDFEVLPIPFQKKEHETWSGIARAQPDWRAIGGETQKVVVFIGSHCPTCLDDYGLGLRQAIERGAGKPSSTSSLGVWRNMKAPEHDGGHKESHQIRSSSPWVPCRRLDAGRRLSPRVPCRRLDAGR